MKEIYIGEHGKLEPTHCHVTKKPLDDCPIHYNLKNNYYIAVNNGHWVSVEDLEKINKQLSPTKKLIQKEEVKPDDN